MLKNNSILLLVLLTSLLLYFPGYARAQSDEYQEAFSAYEDKNFEAAGALWRKLADEGDAVRKSFNVPKAAFGLFPGRVTYILDKDGVCQKVYDDLADAASHVEVAKETLAEMKSAGKPAASNPLASLFSR